MKTGSNTRMLPNMQNSILCNTSTKVFVLSLLIPLYVMSSDKKQCVSALQSKFCVIASLHSIEDGRLQLVADNKLQNALIRSEIIRHGPQVIKERINQAVQASQKHINDSLASGLSPEIINKNIAYLHVHRAIKENDQGYLAQRILKLIANRTDIPDHTVPNMSRRYHGDTEFTDNVYGQWQFDDNKTRILLCWTVAYNKEHLEAMIQQEES
jgi:hypothetical protein